MKNDNLEIDMAMLLKYVAKEYTERFGTDPHEIKDYYGKKRLRELVDVRNIIFTIFDEYRHKYSASQSAVGRVFNKDHATVIHATKTIKALIDSDAGISRLYNDAESYYRRNILRIQGEGCDYFSMDDFAQIANDLCIEDAIQFAKSKITGRDASSHIDIELVICEK